LQEDANERSCEERTNRLLGKKNVLKENGGVRPDVLGNSLKTIQKEAALPKKARETFKVEGERSVFVLLLGENQGRKWKKRTIKLLPNERERDGEKESEEKGSEKQNHLFGEWGNVFQVTRCRGGGKGKIRDLWATLMTQPDRRHVGGVMYGRGGVTGSKQAVWFKN